MLYGCGNPKNRYPDTTDHQVPTINVPMQSPGMSYDGANNDDNTPGAAPLIAPPTLKKPSKIQLFVENSGSIIGGTQGSDGGYVNGNTEYVEALTDIAQLPAFITQSIPVEISFVNGKQPITVTPIGNSFGNRLNKTGMNVGQTGNSDLNEMFQLVLDQARDGVIDILVSDGIYDIGTGDANALTIKGKDTRTAFLNRLSNSKDNLQTLIVKMSSQFKGKYCYATRTGSIQINQKRPYYIWIIGDCDMINTYFSDDVLMRLKGYQDHARFVKIGNNTLPFEIDLPDCNGTIRPNHRDSHALDRHEAYHNQLELALIVDYGGLYYPDSYLQDVNNYSCDFNFSVKTIRKATSTQTASVGVSNYERPFLIVLETNQNNPRGRLTLKLKNTHPSWIDASNANDEHSIDSTTTYGFSTLTKGIREAYEYVSDSIPAVFEVTFN